MFHFLVNCTGWEQSHDTLDESRVLEYTDAHLIEEFKPGGRIDTDRVKQIPAIFAPETGGDDEQLTRVGYITDVSMNGRDVNLHYIYDPNIPPISNTQLENISDKLSIQPFEFRRTHWSIKDVDLFKVLYANQISSLPSPRVFSVDAIHKVEDDLISVMMPFSAGFQDVDESIKQMAAEIDMRCLRADDIWEHDTVIQDVVTLIGRSRIVICDCTGKNPNVFYEAGIAHTLGKDVILLTQSEDDIPFDLRHMRYLKYLNNDQGREEMIESLTDRIQTLIEGR